MREQWNYDGNLQEFVSYIFGVIVVGEAVKISDVIGKEAGTRLMTMTSSVDAVDDFSKFAWNNFGINIYVIMTEIKRMVEEMSDDDWNKIELFIADKCKQYEEERE